MDIGGACGAIALKGIMDASCPHRRGVASLLRKRGVTVARNLYRVYLYVVAIGSLIIAAVGVYFLLGALFAQTALRGSMPAPTQDEMIQRVVLAVVFLAVAGALGGLHYWLIRRDAQVEPAAASGAIRAFFLNLVEAGAVITAVIAGTSTLSGMAYGPTYGGYSAADPMAGTLATFGVAAALEWERRRTQAAPGMAMVFQRLHLYGVPVVILLISALGAWQTAVRETVAGLLYSAGQVAACATSSEYYGPTGPCYSQADLWLLWSSALLVTAVWGWYALLVRGDVHSKLRQVLHLLSFTLGLVFVLVGVERGLELSLRSLLGASVSWVDLIGSYEFTSALVVGLLVALAYGLWLRREAASLPMGAPTVALTVSALAAVSLAVPFWWGAGYGLYTAVESVAASVPQETAAWAAPLALLLTGVGYIPIALDLHRRSARSGITGPERGYDLALLAAGALTGAVGAAVALYALITAALSAQLPNWQQTARTGAVVLVTGVVVAGIYGWLGWRAHYFKSRAVPAGEEGEHEAAPAPESIEEVLDAFAIGKLTRDEAARQIHDIDQRHPLPV
jgi:Domain of unknown function (DUF5671)